MTVIDINNFDTYRFNLLVAKIANVKADYDADLVDQNEFLKGYRYNDNDRIARMILGDIYSECGYDAAKANSKFLSLDSTQMLSYIKKAVLESASADHWYTYEKQW